jgi:hypothetical protein
MLAALASQRVDLPWDFLAIDSGSTDGTWELLGRFEKGFPVPFRRQRIEPDEFDHGDTRNLLAARTSGDLLVFLTQDAIPIGDRWLATLAANFEDPMVAAAYCKNVPRPDADPLTKLFCANDPGYDSGRRVTRIEDRKVYSLMGALDRRSSTTSTTSPPRSAASSGNAILFLARASARTSSWPARSSKPASTSSTTTRLRSSTATTTPPRPCASARASTGGSTRSGSAAPASRARPDARALVRRQLEVDASALRTSGLDEKAREAALGRARELREAAFSDSTRAGSRIGAGLRRASSRGGSSRSSTSCTGFLRTPGPARRSTR